MTKQELHRKIGNLLKLERRRQKLSLEDLSAQLKIAVKSLQHIEAGEVEALPSELYFNLFAKSYAEALGIDYARTLEAIKEEMGEPLENDSGSSPGKAGATESADADDKPQAEKSARPSAGTRYLKTWGYVFGGLILLFFVFLVISKLLVGSGKESAPPDGSANNVAKDAAMDAGGESSSDVYADFDWSAVGYPQRSDLHLRLAARRESWSTVLADGDTVIYRTLVPGRVYDVTAKYRLRVSIAVPTAVEVTLNGRPVDLRNRNSGRISQVWITQLNVDSILSAQAAAGTAEDPNLNNTRVSWEPGDEP
jgi:transcriptional regulator with XRE-family HTH domain